MSAPATPPRQSALGGTALVMFGEGISLPAALVTAAVLTRGLGPEGYGRFTVAATLVMTVEWLLIAGLSHAIVRFVAEAADWRPVAATAMRASLFSGAVVGAILFGFSGPVAQLLGDPQLRLPLRLFAGEIPLFTAFSACRHVLAGLGSYRRQALAGAARWLARMTLIVLLIYAGWGVEGAVIGSIGGVLLALLVAVPGIGATLFRRAGFPLRDLYGLALPTFLLLLTVRLLDRIGLLLLSALRGAGAEVGYYSAAQNLAMITGVIAMTVSPIIISTVSAARRDGREAHARRIADGVIRAAIALFPFAAIVAGCAPELFALLFGEAFVAAAPLGRWLAFVAVGLVVVSIAVALLAATGKVWRTVAITLPLLPLSVGAHLLLIPRLGALGAAVVTTVTALTSAAACVVAVKRELLLPLPAGTLWRSAAVSAVAWQLAASWPTPGTLVVFKLFALGLAVPAAFLLTGELDADERSAARAWMGGLRGRPAGN